jgi:hypothetical protein
MMGKKYTKFVWPKYDARYRPGINDVLEEEELFPEEGFSEPEDEGESLYTAQEVWESRIIFRKRNDLIWSRRRIEPKSGNLNLFRKRCSPDPITKERGNYQ